MKVSSWAEDRDLQAVSNEVITKPWVQMGFAQGEWCQREDNKDLTQFEKIQVFKRLANERNSRWRDKRKTWPRKEATPRM